MLRRDLPPPAGGPGSKKTRVEVGYRPAVRRAPRGTERSSARRAELIAVGRRSFADTSYDAFSMDALARQAQVARGLIYHCFRSVRGCYPAVTGDPVAGPVTFAADGAGPPPVERVHRAVDSYLRYAKHGQAAHRAIVSGGVGFDTEAHAVRDGVREAVVATVAEGAHGRTDIAPVARMGLPARGCSVEGAVLAWIDRGEPFRETMGELLVKPLGGAVRAVEELDPACPALAPAPARRDA